MIVGAVSLVLSTANLPAQNLSPPNPPAAVLRDSITRAMTFLEGKEGTGGLQYRDYVVFCGLSVAREYPEYKGLIEQYGTWITKNDRFHEQLPYQSSCHVMALDLIGQHERAVEIFAQLKPLANDGKWFRPSHIGWYLYGCIVAGDSDLLEKTWNTVLEIIEQPPHPDHYFTAYCLWKAYEKTTDERYRQAFLAITTGLKAFREKYFEQAAKDGHAGMVLSVFCRAFNVSQDEEYREIAGKLAGILVASQAGDGSWNNNTAYTIMPAEGLTHFLRISESSKISAGGAESKIPSSNSK